MAEQCSVLQLEVSISTTAWLLKTADRRAHKPTIQHDLVFKDCCNLFHLFPVDTQVLAVFLWTLNTSKFGGSTASLGNLLQCSTILAAKKDFMKSGSIIHTNANPIIPIKLPFCKQSVIQSDSESHGVFSAMENSIMFPQFPQLITFCIYRNLEFLKKYCMPLNWSTLVIFLSPYH